MQSVARLCVVLAWGPFVAGCQPESTDVTTEDPAIDTVATAPAISLADVAGTWDMRTVPVAGPDTTATIYQAQVTADGWTLLLPERDPIVATVSTAGDSIMVDAGPYASVRREGLTVTTNSVYRLVDGRLVGTTVAHYVTADADSVLTLNSEGTRAP